MGVEKGSTGPVIGAPWARVATDGGVATDANARASVLEYLLRDVMKSVLQNGIVMASTERCQFNSTTKRITAPGSSAPIIGVIGGRPFRMTSAMEESSTADSGTTGSLVDSGLATSDDGWWAGLWVVFTSGANNGLARQVTTYNNSTKTLSWTTPLGTAVGAGDTFVVTAFHISGMTDSATNYIYVTEGSKLNSYGVAAFTATTSATAEGTNLLIATAVLNGSSVVTSSSNTPANSSRHLYPGMGRGDIETATAVAYSGLLAGGTTDVIVPHSDFLSIGGRTFTATGDGVTCTAVETYKSNTCTVRLTNGSSYTRNGTLTVTIQGSIIQRLT